MSTKTKLTKSQKEIMSEFYGVEATKVIYNKAQRKNLWDIAKQKDKKINLNSIKRVCPAFALQIQKSDNNKKNIQSAVFSECVYAQTLANMLNLNVFVNCENDPDFIPENIKKKLEKCISVPRYVYSTEDKKRMLVQAGGCDGVDSALVDVDGLKVYTIEFKEPGAKISEPDLPKYDEDGILKVTADFLKKYPQFGPMLKEQKGLNFFDVMGSNVHNFSAESIKIAVSNNYTEKHADVVCTEDKNGMLVILPTDQVVLWATKIEGEIRPAGRNKYKVWTPKALRKFLDEKGATIDNDGIVNIKKQLLTTAKERGGKTKTISRYKINSLFFVYVKNCTEENGVLSFKLDDVKQLNPTIAGKMFFADLDHKEVFVYYSDDFK